MALNCSIRYDRFNFIIALFAEPKCYYSLSCLKFLPYVEACQYHPGFPVFHDALKGWSCCKKRSTDFTDFLNIPGCTRGHHSNVKPLEPEKPAASDKCCMEEVCISASLDFLLNLSVLNKIFAINARCTKMLPKCRTVCQILLKQLSNKISLNVPLQIVALCHVAEISSLSSRPRIAMVHII